uniref:Uncharacterized protein n=1 Tax=Zea mays TaxID=4577 RepID=C4J3B8_MAIZE|nr:unknown [Zea mays]
MFSSCAKSSGP